MPKLTLLLGRKTVEVYDIDAPTIRVGRSDETDIVIDNPSVSRRHAEIRKADDGWLIEDLGSSNGTFVNGSKVEGEQPLAVGDEISLGKFSLVFGKVVGDAGGKPRGRASAAVADFGGTTQIKPHEVQQLLDESQKKRQSHVEWQAGGQRGTHYLTEAPAVLIGRSDLCDVKVPKGPKHHILVIRTDEGTEVRDLTWWGRMKVRGSKTRRARLRDGDVVEAAGLELTFVGDLA